MNLRRIIYIAVVIMAVALILRPFAEENSSHLIIEDSLSREEVMEILTSAMVDYNLKENSILYFSDDYRGYEHEVFYITTENEQVKETHEYRVVNQQGKLKVMFETTFPGINLPAEKFDAYLLKDGKWESLDT